MWFDVVMWWYCDGMVWCGGVVLWWFDDEVMDRWDDGVMSDVMTWWCGEGVGG